MTDAITVRVCGADRRLLPDRYDLEVSSDSRTVARERDCVGEVTVANVSPVKTYRVAAYPTRYRPVSAFVLGAGEVDLFCPVHPGRVTSVQWPETYPTDLTRVIDRGAIDALGDVERAGLLNVYAKLEDADLSRLLIHVRKCCGDRIYASVYPDLETTLRESPHFAPADGTLHAPPLGFDRIGSWKERGIPYGGLQVTLFTDGEVFDADIDIDDAGGLGHVFQVLEHWLTNGKTHPYDIHQILTFHQGLDPGYRLVTA